jgi:hypothetical protein
MLRSACSLKFTDVSEVLTASIDITLMMEAVSIPQDSRILFRTIRGKDAPNVMLECLTLLFRIQEVSGSNLGLETGYPRSGFSWFSSVLPDKCWDSALKLGHNHFILHPFQSTSLDAM